MGGHTVTHLTRLLCGLGVGVWLWGGATTAHATQEAPTASPPLVLPDTTPQMDKLLNSVDSLAELNAEFSAEGGFEALPSLQTALDAAHVAAAEPMSLHGLASWYSDKFHGRRTASGEPYLRHGFTIAHRQWPLGAKVSIRNPANGIKVTATVNDRGPFHPNRLIDVSFAIAKALGIVQQGVAEVEVSLLSESEPKTTAPLALPERPARASRPSLKPPTQWPPKTP